MLYMGTLEYFPSQFLGTVFGVCNVTARSITILSPMVAEADPPTPTFLIIASCLIAVICSRFLKTPAFKSKPDEAKVDRALEKYHKPALSSAAKSRNSNGIEMANTAERGL